MGEGEATLNATRLPTPDTKGTLIYPEDYLQVPMTDLRNSLTGLMPLVDLPRSSSDLIFGDFFRIFGDFLVTLLVIWSLITAICRKKKIVEIVVEPLVRSYG